MLALLRRSDLPAKAVIGLAGLGLILLAIVANQDWFDRHFLPSFAQTRAFQWHMIEALRAALALAGLAILLFVRPRSLVTMLSVLLAVAAAVTATELVLRTRTWRAAQDHMPQREPLRRPDPLLGWVFAANRTINDRIDGGPVHYATDANGYRVAAAVAPTDFSRPTIVLAGESILFGYGLDWPDTIQARLAARTGLAVANLSVNAYGTDQIALRLHRELPRFERPVAVVILFTSFLLDRNLDTDRPHLDARLRWHPAAPPPLRLVELGRRLLRYRDEAAIAEGVAMSRAALRAGLAEAQARHAQAIILVPQFLPENPAERAVRVRVLDEAGLPYLLVPLDPSWRLIQDRHPDARGAHAIAAALARRLRAER
jgi:hypothetical protein